MRNLKLVRLFKLIFVLALLFLCALLAWAIVLYVLGLNVQWWVKAMVLTCLGATIIIIVLLRKLWLKRKEMKFVDGIIGTDMPGNISAIDDASRELGRRFKQAISTLKKSHLKGRGNPLYVLPWYMMVGKSGAGKSTAIKSARLPSPFGDINRISGIEGTRNCDWWFFDDSVVIDIAGRYALHRNEELDQNEWHAFLEHLVKYRKKEPINGIIVTAEADQLLEGDLEKIEEEGRTIRKRIDEVIHVMGAKFPIYLLVTKCDLVFGMNRFCRLLSETTLDQAMGLMNHDGETDIAIMVNKTMNTLVDKLKDIRLILSNKEEVRDQHYVDPEVLLFPDELARLRNGLMVFCKGAFKDNPFQELPPVRGIYFCSGQQSGRPVNSQASATSKLGSQELPGTGHGFFLHDFFSKILPADRPLYAPTRRAKEWHRLTNNLWLTGFITVALIFCILLTHSWNENKSAINSVSPEFKKTISFKNDPIIDTDIMAQFGQQIQKIEKINATWKTPRLGLNASIRLELDLKQRYCQRFHEHFDADINNKIESRIANGGWDQNNFDPAVRYVPFIVRRVNLMKARSNGAGFEQLADLPDPDYALMIFGDDQKPHGDDVLSHYKEAYINYLIWQKDAEPLNKSLAGMQRLLANYFAESKGDMRWLITWANRHLKGKAVTLNAFWHGNKPDTALASVGPAFTREGQKLIGHFVTDELDAAVDQSLQIAQPKERFATWYQDAYYGAWINLCANFDQGRTLFKTNNDWEHAMERLTGDATPYMVIFDTMEKELFPVLDQERWPSVKLAGPHEEKYGTWLHQIRTFCIVRHAAAGDTLADNPINEKIGNKVTGKAAFAAKIALGTMEDSRLAKAKEAYKQYKNAMAGFAGITTDKNYAHQVARAGFDDNPAESRPHLYAANKGVTDLKIALTPEDTTLRNDTKDPFWSLLREPLDLLWQFSVAQAGCNLQDLWDQEVIVKIQGIHDPRQMASMLFGDQGLAPKYMQTHARPFVQQSSTRGYYTLDRQGARIPFHNGFFDYLKQGERWGTTSGGGVGVQKSYSVTVVAYPTDVNAEARIKPHMTRLVLEGAEGGTTLENKQYPIEKKFTWLPASDSAVLLQILFENMTLTVRYDGYCAFGQFLREFSSGHRIFPVQTFPDQLTELNRIGVTQIEVIYKLQESQIQPVVRLLSATPGQPPRRIVSCAKL
jgi:type VI secretion system protein ImpL